MMRFSPKFLIWLTAFAVMGGVIPESALGSSDASARQANAACGQYQRFANAHRYSSEDKGICHSAIYLIQHIARTASAESSATSRFHQAQSTSLRQSEGGQVNANVDLQHTLNSSRQLMETFVTDYRHRIRASDFVLNARDQNLEKVRNTQTRDANGRARAEDQLSRAYSALERARNYAQQRVSTSRAGIFETIVDGSEASQLQNALSELGISTNQHSRILHDNANSSFDHLAESIERNYSAPSQPGSINRELDTPQAQAQRPSPGSPEAPPAHAGARGAREPGAEPPVANNRELTAGGSAGGEASAPANTTPAGGLRTSTPENETAPAMAQQTVVTREEVVIRSENTAGPREQRDSAPQVLVRNTLPTVSEPTELEIARETPSEMPVSAGTARLASSQDSGIDDSAGLSGMSLDSVEGGAEGRGGFEDPMTLALAQSFEKRLADEAAMRMAQATAPSDTSEINYSGASRAGVGGAGSATAPVSTEETQNKKESTEEEERTPASMEPSAESEAALAAKLLRGEDALPAKDIADLETMNPKSEGEDSLLDSLGIPRRNDFNSSLGIIAPLTVAQATAADPISAVAGPATIQQLKLNPLPKVDPRDAARAQALIDELSATVREDKPARARPLKLAANPSGRK